MAQRSDYIVKKFSKARLLTSEDQGTFPFRRNGDLIDTEFNISSPEHNFFVDILHLFINSPREYQ